MKSTCILKWFREEDLLVLSIAILYYMIIKARFQILKGYQNNHVTIGFGSYGQVKLARDLQNGQIVAVKIIKKIAKNEVMMHYGLSHPKIIKLLDVHIDTERQITYMILQYAECGTLFDKIKMQAISRAEIKQYFRDICQGVTYLHTRNIMHRDIKPENVLLNKKNEAKLCDFGFAALLGQRMTLCEMIQNRPYDYKIDIWALGILLFQLIAGHAPFRGDRPEQVLEQMKTKILFNDRFQNQDISLIKLILRVTPHKRPTIHQIMSQPFFKIDQKSEQIGNRSTANSQGARKGNYSLQYLSQSFNPKKIAQIQKFLENEHLKESQKNIYPSFQIPKNTQKFGLGATVPIHQHKEVKAFSPQHGNKLMLIKKPQNGIKFPLTRPINFSSVYTGNPQSKSSTRSGIYSSAQIKSTQQESGISLVVSKGSINFRSFS